MGKKIILGTGTLLNERERLRALLMKQFPTEYEQGRFIVSNHMGEIIHAAVTHPHAVVILEATWKKGGGFVSNIVVANEIRARTFTAQLFQYTLHPGKDEGEIFHGVIQKNCRNEAVDGLISHIESVLRPISNFV